MVGDNHIFFLPLIFSYFPTGKGYSCDDRTMSTNEIILGNVITNFGVNMGESFQDYS